MRILDQQRYWNFFKAYFVCFVSLVGLYVVLDAFANLDEFSERTEKLSELFTIMGRHYLVRLSLFYDRLCGVITMMAAIFTVTWMQKNNEWIAILAAGISTQRAIRPVLISCLLVSAFAVFNQECIIPIVSDELQKTADDDGSRKVLVFGRYDLNDILIHGKNGDRLHQALSPFNATLPVAVFGAIRELKAGYAQYYPGTDGSAPWKDGWLLRGAKISPPLVQAPVGPILTRLTPAQLALLPEPPQPEKLRKPELRDRVFLPVLAPLQSAKVLTLSTIYLEEAYFLKTNVSFAAVTRNRMWYQFAPTTELILAIADPSNSAVKTQLSVFVHARLLRPLLSLTLLVLSLPLVLAGEGRSMFINLGLALATSALFYAGNFLSQYLGDNAVLSPELAAWSPLIVFASIAVARWDTIRT